MLKQRIISGILLCAVITPLLFLSHIPLLLNFAVGILSAYTLFEILGVTKYIETKNVMAISLIFAFAIPFIRNFDRENITRAIFIFAVLLFATIIFSKGNYSFEHIGVVFLVSMIIPFFYSTLLYVRSLENGQFSIFLVFIGAFGTDVGAYFSGMLFGRHKLAEHISPNKTVEGAIGGIVFAVAFFLLYYLIIYTAFGQTMNVPVLVVAAILTAVVSQIGDLSASIIKRTFHVKDFGQLMPGHGGLFDRFDSVLFASPFLYVFLSMFSLYN